MKEPSFLRITSRDVEYWLDNLPQLVFEVTDLCNLNCKYCAYSDMYSGFDDRKSIFLSFDRVKMLIDWLRQRWNKAGSVTFSNKLQIGFYGGEPLMAMDFIKNVVEYIGNFPVGRETIYSMTTNAMLLDRYMDYLVEKNFQLLISFDGDREGQSYRTDHSGGNSFDKVYKNVKLLRVKHPEYFEKKVRFNTVLHNRNSVKGAYEFFQSEFGKTPRIASLNPYGIRPDKMEEFNRTYKNVKEDILNSSNCEELISEMGFSYPDFTQATYHARSTSGNYYNFYHELLLDTKKDGVIPTGTCIPFWKKMFITVNGKILQCERISHQFGLGQLHEGHVELDFKKIAEQHNSRLFRYEKQCKKCYAHERCSICVLNEIGNDYERCRYQISEHKQIEHTAKMSTLIRNHPDWYDSIMNKVVIVR